MHAFLDDHFDEPFFYRKAVWMVATNKRYAKTVDESDEKTANAGLQYDSNGRTT